MVAGRPTGKYMSPLALFGVWMLSYLPRLQRLLGGATKRKLKKHDNPLNRLLIKVSARLLPIL